MENEKNEIMIVTELREEYNKAIAEIENVLSVYDKALLDIEKDILNSSKERLINKINEAADEMSDTDIRQYKFFLANEMKNCNLISTKYMVEDNGIAINQVNKKVNKLNKEVDAVINSQIEILNNEEDILSYAQENNQLAKKGNRALRVVLALGGVTLLASLIAHAVSCSKGNNVVVTEINTDNDHKIESTIAIIPTETIAPVIDSRMSYEELGNLINDEVNKYAENPYLGKVSVDEYRTLLEWVNGYPSNRIITQADIENSLTNVMSSMYMNRIGENLATDDGFINTNYKVSNFRWSNLVLTDEETKNKIIKLEDLSDILSTGTEEEKSKALEEAMIILEGIAFEGEGYKNDAFTIVHGNGNKQVYSDINIPEAFGFNQIPSSSLKTITLAAAIDTQNAAHHYDKKAYLAEEKMFNVTNEYGTNDLVTVNEFATWNTINHKLYGDCYSETYIIKVLKEAAKLDMTNVDLNNNEEIEAFCDKVIAKMNATDDNEVTIRLSVRKALYLRNELGDTYDAEYAAISITNEMNDLVPVFASEIRGAGMERMFLTTNEFSLNK